MSVHEPPLGCSVCPEIDEESVQAKKTQHVAISEGWLGRPMGLVNSSWAFLFMVAGIKGVLGKVSVPFIWS